MIQHPLDTARAIAYVTLIMGIIAFSVVAARGHDGEIIHCDRNLKIKAVKKLGERVNPNGTVSEAYDRNRDGQPDIEAISHIKSMDGKKVIHDPHPFLYVVDLDFDGVPDAVYIDKSGIGNCDDIVLYKDLRATSPEDEIYEKELGRL